MSSIGVQAGLFYKYNVEGSIYFTDDRGSASPLTNPLVKTAVKAASKFACLNFSTSPISVSPQLASDFSASLSDYSTEEMVQFHQALIQKLTDLNMQCYDNPFDNQEIKIVNNLARLIQWALTQHNQVRCIENQAKDKNPNDWVSLLNSEQICTPIEALLSLAAKNKLIMRILKAYFLDAGLAKSAKEFDEIHGKFIDRGEIFKDQSNERVFTRQALGSHFEDLMHEEQAADLLPSLEEIEALTLVQAKSFATIAQNIDKLFKEDPKAFVILPAYMNPILDNLKGRISEPLSYPIKPRNFLWEIKKTETVVGYLFGSIHQLPKDRPEPLNSQIWNAFNECNALAVEIDPTNQSLKQEGIVHAIASMNDERKKNLRKLLEKSLDRKIDSDDALIEACLNSRLLNSESNGTDMHFIKKAKERELAILSLEDIATHIDAEIAARQQRTFQHLADPTGKVDLHQVHNSFNNFEDDELQKIIDDLFLPGLTEKLDMLWENQKNEEKQRDNLRNQKMIDAINKLIISGMKPFAIAGAFHFAGPCAMHKLMELQGYKVKQIIAEET